MDSGPILFVPGVFATILLICVTIRCCIFCMVLVTTLPAVMILFAFLLVIFFVSVYFYIAGQKTRAPPQRRMYMGSRARQSLSQAEPTIYVSPNNLPPPPKYECLAPPSYEEVVGVHYPQYQSQPITHPITTAMAQSTSSHVNATDPSTVPPTYVTVTSETRTSVQVAAS